MKASDITDGAFIDAVSYCCAEWEMGVASRWDVTAVLAGHPEDVGGGPRDYPDMPWKVVLAKARSLIRRGLIDGCDCGCRGNFEVKPTLTVRRADFDLSSTPLNGERTMARYGTLADLKAAYDSGDLSNDGIRWDVC